MYIYIYICISGKKHIKLPALFLYPYTIMMNFGLPETIPAPVFRKNSELEPGTDHCVHICSNWLQNLENMFEIFNNFTSFHKNCQSLKSS